MEKKTPKPPRKGTAAAKMLECIEQSKSGLTAFEVEHACGIVKNQHTRLMELRDKGLIETVGKRESNGIKADVWKAKGKKQAPVQRKKRSRRLGFIPKQNLDPYECPACGKTIYLLLEGMGIGSECIMVEPQRRIIVFDGPYTTLEYEDESGKKTKRRVPKEPIKLFEEWTGKLVVGRAASESEREYYAEYKKIRGKPWTIGFEGHLSNCTKWKRWLNGKAEEKLRKCETKWDKKKRRYGLLNPESEIKSMTSEPPKS